MSMSVFSLKQDYFFFLQSKNTLRLNLISNKKIFHVINVRKKKKSTMLLTKHPPWKIINGLTQNHVISIIFLYFEHTMG